MHGNARSNSAAKSATKFASRMSPAWRRAFGSSPKAYCCGRWFRTRSYAAFPRSSLMTFTNAIFMATSLGIVHISFGLVSCSLICNYLMSSQLLWSVDRGSSPTQVMTNTLLAPTQWAVSEFALAKLGDQRRTQRLVKIATNLAQTPGGTLPQAFSERTALKAAYRLFDQPEVAFEQIQSSHWQRTGDACHQPGEYLLIDDTSELDYTHHPATEEMGSIGDGKGRRLLLHSTLALRLEGGLPRATPRDRAGLAAPAIDDQSAGVRPLERRGVSPRGASGSCGPRRSSDPSTELQWVQPPERQAAGLSSQRSGGSGSRCARGSRAAALAVADFAAVPYLGAGASRGAARNNDLLNRFSGLHASPKQL